MITVKATGKTGRGTEVLVNGERIPGLTGVTIHPITKDSLLRVNLEVIVDEIVFDGQLDILAVYDRREGTQTIFKHMEKVDERHDSEAVSDARKDTGTEPSGSD